MFVDPVNFNKTEVVFDIGGIPDATIDAAKAKIVEYFRQKYGVIINPKDINVESFRHVLWNDSSLGCPEDGMFYTQPITPGYEIEFSVKGWNGGLIEVHTNADGSQSRIQHLKAE